MLKFNSWVDIFKEVNTVPKEEKKTIDLPGHKPDTLLPNSHYTDIILILAILPHTARLHELLKYDHLIKVLEYLLQGKYFIFRLTFGIA